MRAARESGDREAMEAAAEAFRGLRKESPMGDLREDLEKVLTDEQKAKLRDLAAERRGGEKPGAKLKQRVEKVEQGLKEGKLPPMFDNVDLSDEQRARIIEILEKTIAEGKAFREANREKIRELMKKAREAHRAGDKEAAEAARNEIRELMNGAPRGKAREAIAEVLTDEQRQQLREAAGKRMKERRDRRGGEGWGPRGGERRGPRGGEPRSDAAPPAEDFGLKL